MSTIKSLQEFHAATISADISRPNQTVTLDLQGPGNHVFAVTMSIQEFRRFHQHVAERLRKDTQLFDPVSRL